HQLRIARRLKLTEPSAIALEEFDRVYLYERTLAVSAAPFSKALLHERAADLCVLDAEIVEEKRRQLELRTWAIGHYARAGVSGRAWEILDELFDELTEMGHYATLIALHHDVGFLSDPVDEALRLRGLAKIL